MSNNEADRLADGIRRVLAAYEIPSNDQFTIALCLKELAALAKQQAPEATAERTGPGTAPYRLNRMLEEFEKRFPDPEPWSAKAPEPRYWAMLDAALADQGTQKAEQQASPQAQELDFYEDCYTACADMLATQPTDQPGGLPGSVVESFQMLLEHWKATPPKAEATQAAAWGEAEQQVQDLAMTVRMLCSKLKKHEPDSHLIKSAMAYQQARGLTSPLREASPAQSPEQPAQAEPMSAIDRAAGRLGISRSEVIQFHLWLRENGKGYSAAILAEAGIKEKTNG